MWITNEENGIYKTDKVESNANCAKAKRKEYTRANIVIFILIRERQAEINEPMQGQMYQTDSNKLLAVMYSFSVCISIR